MVPNSSLASHEDGDNPPVVTGVARPAEGGLRIGFLWDSVTGVGPLAAQLHSIKMAATSLAWEFFLRDQA